MLNTLFLGLSVVSGIILAVWWLKRKNIFSSSYSTLDLPNQEEEVTAKCDNCQCVSSMPESFQSTPTDRLCPRCFQKEELKSLQNTFQVIILVIYSSAILAILLFWFNPPWHYLFVNTVVAALFWCITLVLYALVQAGAALLVGGEIFLIQIGKGPTLFEKMIGTCQVSLRKFPSHSFTRCYFPERASLELRLAVFYLSGLLLHGAIVLLLWQDFELPDLLSTYAFSEVFFLTNAYMFLTIVIPGQSNNAGLLERLFAGKIDLDTVHANYYLIKSESGFLAKHYEEARDVGEEGLKLYPQNALLRIDVAMFLSKLGRHIEALQLLKDTLSLPDLPPLQRAFVMNNFSWITLLIEEDRELAYDYAQQAFSTAPWISYFEGTLGAALVEVGKTEQGIYHLLQAYEHHPTPSSQATNLAYAAIGYHRLGDEVQAKQRLEQALAIDMTAEIVQKAQREIGLSREV